MDIHSHRTLVWFRNIFEWVWTEILGANVRWLWWSSSNLPIRLIIILENKKKSALELTGTPYDFKIIDLNKDEQKSEWFTAINPKQEIPAIADEDFILTESSVIMKYICNLKGETSLYPRESKLGFSFESLSWRPIL